MDSSKHQELVGFIWSVADLLRGDYKQSEYGKVILPFTVLRRLDCVLEPTKDAVLAEYERWKNKPMDATRLLQKAAGQSFYNTSRLTLRTVVADPSQVRKNLVAYLGAFSANAREVMDKYEFDRQIDRLADAKLLYRVAGKFAEVDLHPDTVDNHQMGSVFEDLIRRFSEQSNETAGEHFTPREVIRLMVNLLLAPDDDALTLPGTVRTILDPACGTGGMLTEAETHILDHNPQATVEVYGQELNPESYAICRSDLMIKGHESSHIKFGDSFRDDGHKYQRFNYLLANPPFGVEWKKARDEIEEEHEEQGWEGRFGAGLPRINDGSLLFLQHMISKMKRPDEGGGRVAIVFNGSPLFTGAAGSGESRIRQWILENDWLEGIVALPDQLFYNTGISTYFWIATNRKADGHRGKVVLLDARDYFAKMRKSLGDKRKYVTDEQIADITRLYRDALTVADDPDHPMHGKVKVFRNRDFGYHRITVERPLKLRFEVTDETVDAVRASKPLTKQVDADALAEAVKSLMGQTWMAKLDAFAAVREKLCAAGELWPSAQPFLAALRDVLGVRDPDGEVQLKKGDPEPDPDLRDYENVPLDEDIDAYVQREVLPHVPDAWVDHTKTKVGYEIPFTRHFYVYKPPRPLAEIDAELKALESEIQQLLGEVTR